MTPLVSVISAVATSLLTLALWMASGRVFSSYGWMVPYLFAVSILLYVLAAILAVIHWKREHKKDAAASPPPATQPINISLSNIGNPVVAFAEKPQRTSAQQHHYETAQKALQKLGPNAVIALRHLKTHRTLIFGMYDPLLPAGMNHEQAMSIYQSCVAEGLVTQRDVLKPGTAERTFEIAPTMNEVLDELLYLSSDDSRPMSQRSTNVTKRDWIGEWNESKREFTALENSDVFAEFFQGNWAIRSDRNPLARDRVEAACELAGSRLFNSPGITLSETVQSQKEHWKRWLYFLKETQGLNRRICDLGSDNSGYIERLAQQSALACTKCAAKAFN